MRPCCAYILSVLVYFLLLYSILVVVIILFLHSVLHLFYTAFWRFKVLNVFVFMYYAFSVITIQLWLLMVTYDCYECWAFTMHFGGHYYTVDV